MQVANLNELEAFTTLEGSEIRELAGPERTAARNQSLAEATVPPGAATEAHFHRSSEEICYFARGEGRMVLGADEIDVGRGDCVVIPPGVEHKLFNGSDSEPLVLLCCCSPGYTDEDTILTDR